LPDADVAALSSHVRGCARCQALLDRLSDDVDLRQWVPSDGRLPPAPPADRELIHLLSRVRVMSFPTPTDTLSPDATTPELPVAFLAPPSRPGDLGTLGPYPVRAELGRGGMGIVLEGYDHHLQRRVALKVLRPELANERARVRFFREAQVAAHVEHENVVRVYAVVNPPDGLPYLVMEYLPWPTLTAWIGQHQFLPPRAAVAVVVQVAEGLAAAHAAGLIHRDIKPGNVLVEPATSRAKLADFGMARLTEGPSDLTAEQTVAGTPAYMSPEQAQGTDPLDARTDVYGLGVTLYEALTGHAPFRGAPHRVLRQVVEDEPPPPHRLNDAVPRDLETVCLQAMAKDPQRRYPTALAVAADLRRWQRGEPVHARPAGRTEYVWRWARRNPWVAGLGAALVLVLVLGFVGVVWQWQRAETKSAEAEKHREVAQKNFAQARQVVDTFVTRVLKEGLLDQPGQAAQRKRLLADALGYYRDFLKQRSGDPALQTQVAETYLKVAAITARIGNKAEALAAGEQALAAYQALSREQSKEAQWPRKIAVCLYEIAAAQLDLGRLEDSLRSYQQYQNLCERLGREMPDKATWRANLAVAFGGLANAHMEAGRQEEALRLYHRARAIQEQIAAEFPKVASNLRNLSLNYQQLGFSCDDSHEAIRWVRQATALQEQLVRDYPKATVYQRDLAHSCQILAIAHLTLGETEEALRCCGQGISLLERAVGVEPASTLLQCDLAQLFNIRCSYLIDLGRLEEAIEDSRKARAICERLLKVSPGDTRFRSQAVLCYLQAGEVRLRSDQSHEAQKVFEMALPIQEGLVRSRPDQPRHWFRYGKIQCHLGRHTEAIKSLRQALALVNKGVAEHPHRPAPSDFLGACTYHIGATLEKAGQPGEAIASYRQAIAHQRRLLEKLPFSLQERATLRESYQALARVLRALGRLTEAAALARERRKLWPGDPSELYAVAGELALCATDHGEAPSPYTGEAIDVLREAVGHGFKDLQRLRTDPELDALRSHPDFAQLVADCTKKLQVQNP
jgi:tetratricopeptide (TPR) repeat protein/tRNA A-37 threonylcarbamoyl transferase component Bud32